MQTRSVTIRVALLRVFFALVLGVTSLVGAVSFFQFRASLESEIASNLQFGATAVLQRIDALFFERLEDFRVWRRLEIMQDIRVDDVDKRLARFLSDLRAGYGSVYQGLLCTDNAGRVVASTDSAWLGRITPPEVAWKRVSARGAAEVVLEPLRAGSNTVALRTAVPDAFGKGELGYLYALLDWHEVLTLLDDAVAGGERDALLLDADGKVIGASARLRQRTNVSGLNFSGWRPGASPAGAYIHEGQALGYDALLVGSAKSAGYQHFPGFGWRLLIVEPASVAYAPIWHLLWVMSAMLLLTLAVAGWISVRLADRVAAPIIGLTDITRRFRAGEAAAPPRMDAVILEVGELNRAFAEMIAALEHSREQVVRAGKLAVVGEMAAIMAHEVRTPLGILRSSAQMLERQPNLGEKERELTGFIISETDRLNRLVTMLLECASPRPPHFRPHDLHDIAEHVLNLLASKADKKGVQLQRDFAATDSVLACDREQMIQVILNLVINALHFVPAGGRICVATQNAGRTMVMQVSDDGPGIPQDMRARVFDPFFTRREGGVGLGLTIVQQIIHVHHGEIWVTESAWGGACFNVRIHLKEGVGDES